MPQSRYTPAPGVEAEINMARRSSYPWPTIAAAILFLAVLALATPTPWPPLLAQTPQRFGGAYAELGAPRQALVDNWVARFTKVTGQPIEPGPFYDEILPLSAKTTFDAVTHALMTTPLTDDAGSPLGDALSLIEYVESVRGEVIGAAGDRQFRIYVRLHESARPTLERSREFHRGVDNSVYHKGYPLNYRQQGGVPSIQISIAVDGRRADVDVDYRSSSFPTAMFNGHLSSANSDVRAGNNADRHVGRWAGLQNWWRSFFGVRVDREEEQPTSTSPLSLPRTPRAGKKNIDVMVNDFLTAWLIEGDVMAAMSYISPRALACVALESDDPGRADAGMAPFELLTTLKRTHDALAPQTSLVGLTVGRRLPIRDLRVVQQPHHAQFVIAAVPDDIAAAFDCEGRLTLADTRRVARTYGNYFGATFYVNGQQNQPVTLLWGREDGYWRIVSWQSGSTDDATPGADPTPEVEILRVPFDPELHKAVRGFLEAWLVRRDYDAAFAYLSPKSYACYDLDRESEQPAASSAEDAARRLREGLARAGDRVPGKRPLEAIVQAADPIHRAIRLMDHRDRATFSLTSVPDALAEAAECDARTRGLRIPDTIPPEYGRAFGASVRFRTPSGDAPVLRTMWRREGGAWRIVSYGVELP